MRRDDAQGHRADVGRSGTPAGRRLAAAGRRALGAGGPAQRVRRTKPLISLEIFGQAVAPANERVKE